MDNIHSLSTIQLDRDVASRIVLDSGHWKAGHAIKEGKDDKHYIVQHIKEYRLSLLK